MNVRALAALEPGARARGPQSLESAMARVWFISAIAGQGLFAAYIVAFYGRTALAHDFARWSPPLTRGLVAGDPANNAALVAHLALAFVLLVCGPLQFLRSLRARFPRVHRWNGRAYLSGALVVTVGGLYMLLVHGSLGDFWQHLGIALNAVLLIACAVQAWRFARAREFESHQRWAVRTFLLVNGVWFFRVGFSFWVGINGGDAVGFDFRTFSGPALTAISFGQSLLPLVAYELYLRARRLSTNLPALAASGLLAMLTAATLYGTFRAFTMLWLPKF
jgi:hypothetical protein